MRVLILAGLAAALATSASAASAPAPSDAATSDARCLLTMAAVSANSKGDDARSGEIGTVFFAGRIKARDPNFDFAARLKPLAAAMTVPVLQSELQRCGPIVQAAMGQLENGLQALNPSPSPAAATPAPKK